MTLTQPLQLENRGRVMLTDAACRHATSEDKKVRKLPDAGGLYFWVYADGHKYWSGLMAKRTG